MNTYNSKRRQGALKAVYSLLFVASSVLSGCADMGDDATERGQLMFDLTHEEVQELHRQYLADEPVDLTFARLTAPFDCTLYGDLCVQVGDGAAVQIIAEQVEMARRGETVEHIDQTFEMATDEAMELLEELELSGTPTDEITERSSSGWRTHTIGSHRLRVRNGVTNPLIGKRKAWTQSKFQKKTLGIWGSKKADTLCTNAGTNTQEWITSGGGVPSSTHLLESINPVQVCYGNDASLKVQTSHARNNGSCYSGLCSDYYIHADGCGSAVHNGDNFSACPTTHTAWF